MTTQLNWYCLTCKKNISSTETGGKLHNRNGAKCGGKVIWKADTVTLVRKQI